MAKPEIHRIAVRSNDWERFKLDGGSLVVYPARAKGQPEMPGMQSLAIGRAGSIRAAGEDADLASALLRISTQSRAARTKRQQMVHYWCVAAFGTDHASSLTQRGVRLLEEAIELYQAADGTAEMAHRLIDFIFDRPVGDLEREIGGVGITLLALAAATNRSADKCEADELARVLARPLEHFTARNEDKNAAGFNTVAPTKVDR